jgi:hypothetical protein
VLCGIEPKRLSARNLWSCDLLAPEVAEVFRRMSAFAGGCDLEALAAVAVTGQGQGAQADPLTSAIFGRID